MNNATNLNLDFLYEITNGNETKLVNLIQSFLTEAPLTCEKLNASVRNKNYDTIKSEVHSSKPLYMSIGAASALNIIERIENYTTSPLFYELLPIEIDNLKSLTTEVCTILKNKFNL